MKLPHIIALLGLLLNGAIFGFFYAWVCSTMWGLDVIDPRIAIQAMQGMNASVRNAVFAPAMFGTPVVLLLAAGLSWPRAQVSALCFVASAVIYVLFAAMLTFAVNVPMNEALGQVEMPISVEQARAIWADYSPDWQFWNVMRTIACGIALLITGYGLIRMEPRVEV